MSANEVVSEQSLQHSPSTDGNWTFKAYRLDILDKLTMNFLVSRARVQDVDLRDRNERDAIT